MSPHRDTSRTTSGCGWPNGLPRPALTTACLGRTTSRKSGPVEAAEPWCPTLSTTMSPSTPAASIDCFDASVASPVSSTSTVPQPSCTTSESALLSVVRDAGCSTSSVRPPSATASPRRSTRTSAPSAATPAMSVVKVAVSLSPPFR